MNREQPKHHIIVCPLSCVINSNLLRPSWCHLHGTIIILASIIPESTVKQLRGIQSNVNDDDDDDDDYSGSIISRYLDFLPTVILIIQIF